MANGSKAVDLLYCYKLSSSSLSLYIYMYINCINIHIYIYKWPSHCLRHNYLLSWELSRLFIERTQGVVTALWCGHTIDDDDEDDAYLGLGRQRPTSSQLPCCAEENMVIDTTIAHIILICFLFINENKAPESNLPSHFTMTTHNILNIQLIIIRIHMPWPQEEKIKKKIQNKTTKMP